MTAPPLGFEDDFDVLVVGGGHAGTEAAVAAARRGAHASSSERYLSSNDGAIGGLRG